jgi:hypothetical protein
MATYRGQEIDLTPTDAMATEAKRALQWRKDGHAGGTAVGVARAVQLKNKEELSASTVRRMHSFFSRHAVDKQAEGFRPGEKGYPSKGRVAWAMWGGDAGQTWARGKTSSLDAIDKDVAKKGLAELTEIGVRVLEQVARKGEDDVLQGPACPLATIDKEFNKQQHLFVARVAGLGPADPRQPNDVFWADKGERWNCQPDEARTRLCSNCGHYWRNPHIDDCMKRHDQLTPPEVAPGWADLGDASGYCTLYDLTCSRSRTCVDWKFGGPMHSTDEPSGGEATAEKSDGKGEIQSRIVTIKRMDEEQQVVYGEVYAPNVLDTYGEFMTADDIETMAHRFMRLDLRSVIDTNHDMQPNGSYPVESYIAQEGDPYYTAGAWVLGVKIVDDAVWTAVKSGELNGFSFQSLVKPKQVDVVYTVLRDHVGATEASEDHQHTYFVQLDEGGNVVGGQTDNVMGHDHTIRRASVTELSAGHSHRFFL